VEIPIALGPPPREKWRGGGRDSASLISPVHNSSALRRGSPADGGYGW
jgi:hypothetical protein